MDKRQGSVDNPFEEYMWMGDMDNFDKQVQEQLLEEDFIRQCIEQLLEEEEERDTITAEELIHQKNLENKMSHGEDKPASTAISSSHTSGRSKAYSNGFDGFSKGFRKDIVPVSKSTLNPNAKVFVPQARLAYTSS